MYDACSVFCFLRFAPSGFQHKKNCSCVMNIMYRIAWWCVVTERVKDEVHVMHFLFSRIAPFALVDNAMININLYTADKRMWRLGCWPRRKSPSGLQRTGRRAEILGVKLGFPRSRCGAIVSDVLCVRSYVHFVCVCAYMCMCVCVRTWYIYIYACVYVFVHLCVYTHVYVYVYA